MNGGNIMAAAVMIIESGAVYSVCLILVLGLFLSNSYAQYIVVDGVSFSSSFVRRSF